jgi:hypothetical protein
LSSDDIQNAQGYRRLHPGDPPFQSETSLIHPCGCGDISNLPWAQEGPMLALVAGVVMGESVSKEKREKRQKASWLWPAGVAATGVAGFGLLLLRGCWHRKMSWPVRIQGCAYQVCLGCGVKRLFDEKAFRSYGPFSYDVEDLMAWERAHRPASVEPQAQRPAS